MMDIVELGFLGVHSDEDHQRLIINLISICAFCDSSLWLEKWQSFSVSWW